MDMVEYLDIPWVETVMNQTDGPKPPATVWPWPGMEAWGGLYAMRSDWSPEALYMCIDGGPWGTSHMHGDRLSFVLSAYGEDFVMDPVSTKYRSNEPDAFISRQSAGFLHNTVTVNGVDEFWRDNPIPREATEPLDNTWEHGENYSLFISDYPFQPVLEATWERRVVFADKSYWLMQDVVTAADEDTLDLEQNFQFARDIEIEFDGNTTIATAPNGARLLIVPLVGALQPRLTIGDEEPHVSYWPNGEASAEKASWNPDQPHGRGWIGHGHKLYPAPAVTYVGQMPSPATVTLALVPLAPEEDLSAAPDITKTPDDGTVTWHLPVEGGTLDVSTSVEACEIVQ
ncbi:MAG: heparinase II/III family protein [Armatimonadota bacterium]